MLQCLAFDCDGVLLDSVPVKTRAFARIAEPYGAEARDRFVMYHTVHGGVSRYKKFEWFYREVLGREITPEESAELGRRFAEYSLEEVRRCPMIAGAEDVLRRWHGTLTSMSARARRRRSCAAPRPSPAWTRPSANSRRAMRRSWASAA